MTFEKHPEGRPKIALAVPAAVEPVDQVSFSGGFMTGAEDKEIAKKIGNKIRELRDNSHLKNADLAEVMGRSEEVIRAWIRGQSLSSFIKLRRLAEKLGATPNEILCVEANGSRETDRYRALMEAFEGAFRSIGLSQAEATELVALIEEDATEPSDQPGVDPAALRRSLAEITARRFLKRGDEQS